MITKDAMSGRTRMGRDYRTIFLETYGVFPHSCHFCGEIVESTVENNRWTPVIHHLDHNDENNDPANLVPAHRGCHISYHRSDRLAKMTPEERSDVARNGHKGLTPASRRAMAEKAKAALMALSPEERFARARKGGRASASASPEVRSERSRKANKNMSAEKQTQRAEKCRKAALAAWAPGGSRRG